VKLKNKKFENKSGFGGFQSPEVRNKIVFKKSPDFYTWFKVHKQKIIEVRFKIFYFDI
jgi:hypothetical protein